MGLSGVKFGVEMKKLVRVCGRSIARHPFFVGFLIFLLILYTIFPFVFSIFVYASPVLVSTAVLLGTLLSFGQPNIPEIQIDKEDNRNLHVKAEDDEKYSEIRRDIIEKANMDEAESRERDIQCEKQVIEEAEDYRDSEVKPLILEDAEGEEEVVVVERELLLAQKAEACENEKLVGHSEYARVEYQADSSLGSTWRNAEEEEEDHDESESSSVSGSESESDRAESSSPDASMADIIPMLDELHPLLDLEAPQPLLSHNNSDAISLKSHKSSDESAESEEDSGKEEEGDEDNDEEDEAMGDKDDGSKSVIKWTEDDQKNLMDLGTSEIERNQRLENLIARRRARKSMTFITEKNLIDFDSTDLPFHVAPITTTRRNPFDAPYGDADNMNLPPIPGSAPSSLAPRRNPFDLPYDSNEEKPNLTQEIVQPEFMGLHQKEAFFRRHESFSVGSSFFAFPRHEKQTSKLRPYFLSEQMTSERTTYPLFQRQSTEASDSKIGSAHETESMSSAVDQEHKKPVELDFCQEAEVLSEKDHASDCVEHGSQSSDDINLLEVAEREIVLNQGEIEMEDAETRKGNPSSELKGTTEVHLGLEADEDKLSSQSSLSSSDAKEEVFDVKEDEGSLTFEQKIGKVIEKQCISVQSPPELECANSCGRSSSLSSTGTTIENSSVALRSLKNEEDPDHHTDDLADDGHIKEPVYDSSPPATEKIHILTPISSDFQAEMSDRNLPSEAMEASVKYVGRKTESSSERININESVNDEALAALSRSQAVSDVEPESQVIVIEPSIDVPIELPETSGAQVVSAEEASVISDSKDLFKRSEDHSQDFLLEAIEEKLDVGFKYLKEVGPRRTENEGPLQVAEEADEIKVISEDLLMELDTVGEFSINKMGLEGHIDADIASVVISRDFETKSHGKSDSSILENKGVQVMPLSRQEDDKCSDMIEASSGLHNLAIPVAYIGSSALDSTHGITEDSVVLQSINEEPTSSSTELPIIHSKESHQGLATTKISLDMHDIEAKSPRDVDLIFEKEKSPIKTEGEPTKTGSALLVLEARSVEDIDKALRRITEGKFEDSSFVDLPEASPKYEETNVGHSEQELLHPDSDPVEKNLNLPELEARSIEDINLASKKLCGGDFVIPNSVDDIPGEIDSATYVRATSSEDLHVSHGQLSDTSLDKSPKLLDAGSEPEIKAEERAISLEKGRAENYSQDMSTALAENLNHAVEGCKSSSLSIASDERDKEEGSRKSSSSSSSSGSSSSDSDQD